MGGNWSKILSSFSLVRGKGESVTSRPHELVLDLPAIRTQSKLRFSRKELEPPVTFWKDLNLHPIELLRDIDRYLKRINTERLSDVKRLAWVEQSLTYACPAIRKIYSEQYKADALPESHDRREGLVAAASVCNQLATGFKRQLFLDYNLPDAQYAQVRARVRLFALRIFELIRMEQRLRSMRYQKLPGNVWRDCNRIFVTIAQCEDITEHHQALTCMHLQADSLARELGRRQSASTSIRHIYMAIQLYGLMDTNSVSSRNMHVIDGYLERVIDTLDIKPDDGSPLLTGEVIIYSNQKSPAFFNRQKDNIPPSVSTIREKGLAIRIDVIPLEILLMGEHKKLLSLFEGEKEDQEKVVMDQEDLARLLVVDVMCDRLRMKQRKDKREYIIGQKILYVYNGFMSVYKLLVDIAQEDEDIHEELVSDNELRDALAGRSALIASGVESSECGQWFVQDRSEGGVHIKTQESQFTTAMFIGQLLSFSFSREGLQKPTLGYVARLNRGSIGEIEVTIQILSKYPRATAIQSEFLRKNDMALPAMLLEDEEAGTRIERLVLHHSHHLSPGTTVQIELEEKHREYVIGDLLQMQREFIVYGLLPAGSASAEFPVADII